VFLGVDGCLTWALHVICCSLYVEVMLMHPSRILICFDALHLLIEVCLHLKLHSVLKLKFVILAFLTWVIEIHQTWT
jgi:hypothetical protein